MSNALLLTTSVLYTAAGIGYVISGRAWFGSAILAYAFANVALVMASKATVG